MANIDELQARLDDTDKVLFEFDDDEMFLLKKGLLALKILASNQFGPFICGRGGETDQMGLHEYYHVCPAYGLDGAAVYKKHRDYDAPGY